MLVYVIFLLIFLVKFIDIILFYCPDGVGFAVVSSYFILIVIFSTGGPVTSQVFCCAVKL